MIVKEQLGEVLRVISGVLMGLHEPEAGFVELPQSDIADCVDGVI